MFNSKYSNILTTVLIVAIILIIALIAYFSYDIYRKYYTNKDAGDAANQFQEGYINKIPNKNNSANNNNNQGDIIINELNPTNTTENNSTGNNNTTNVKPKYKDYTMVGTIEISKINLSYPILEKVSTKALDTSVCLMYGTLNEIGNAVVIGHNYRNGTFFSNLYKLSNGDKITISDYTGKKITYTIYDKFEAEPEDVSFYQRNTNGVREITLSTCTDDSSKRTIILAREK